MASDTHVIDFKTSESKRGVLQKEPLDGVQNGAGRALSCLNIFKLGYGTPRVVAGASPRGNGVDVVGITTGRRRRRWRRLFVVVCFLVGCVGSGVLFGALYAQGSKDFRDELKQNCKEQAKLLTQVFLKQFMQIAQYEEESGLEIREFVTNVRRVRAPEYAAITLAYGHLYPNAHLGLDLLSINGESGEAVRAVLATRQQYFYLPFVMERSFLFKVAFPIFEFFQTPPPPAPEDTSTGPALSASLPGLDAGPIVGYVNAVFNMCTVEATMEDMVEKRSRLHIAIADVTDPAAPLAVFRSAEAEAAGEPFREHQFGTSVHLFLGSVNRHYELWCR
eukprot:jgi/Mesen1/7632/ME000004S07903